MIYAALRAGLLLLLMAAHPTAAKAANESVEADASTRQVAITSSFTGVEILVFGAVENSVQPSAEAGTYDVVVVVEGTASPVIVRRKSNLGGLWINAKSMRFSALPSYYAIATTRPLDEIADKTVLAANEIGFEHVRIVPTSVKPAEATDTQDLPVFKEAVTRLKERERLYVKSNFGVTFIGRSLFRATISLPPNVPVGPLTARVYLFKEGQLLGQYKSRVMMERQGIERTIHDMAFQKPRLYGILTVLFAAAAGLLAAFVFPKPA